MEPAPVVAALDAALGVLRQFPDDASALRVLQVAENAIAAAKADHVASFMASEGYLADGASTIKTWLRDQLRLDTSEATRLIRASRTHRELEHIGQLACDGVIGAGHSAAFGTGLDHLGAEVIEHPALASELVEIATHSEPKQLREAIGAVRDHLDPDHLEAAKRAAADRADIRISPIEGYGWVVNGFLPIELGAKFATVLDSLANPYGKSADTLDDGVTRDERTPAQRRLDGLETLCDTILENGLPRDQGVRPHLSVTIDADDLRRRATDPAAAAAPAHLAGFGAIPGSVLEQIMCGADLTPILTAGPHQVLDVGRTERCATPAQRRAITVAQGGTCAAPSCVHPVRHIHHIDPWSRGGPTDLENLIGLCPGCHRAIHAGHLAISRETREFHRPGQPPTRRNRSNSWHTRARIKRRLEAALRGEPEPLKRTG